MWTLALTAFAAGLLIGAAVARAVQARQLAKVKDAQEHARRAQRLAELGAMTGGLAHEIKNPLSTIGLNAQLLAEGVADLAGNDDLKPRLVNRVGALRRETERLKGILEDFLQYAGNVKLHRQTQDLNTAAGELIDFLAPEATRAGVRLRADFPATPVNASVDSRLLKQALLNLLLNAIQAVSAMPVAAGVPHKGEVILATALTPAAKGRPPVPTIRVTDTGPGIDTDTLQRIFQPYFTTKSGGTGLGLPTARRFIQEHGGELTVDSQPGRGTTFTITLPISAEPVA